MPDSTFLSKLKSLFGGAEGQDCVAQTSIALQPDDVDAAVIEAVRRHGRVVGGVVDVPLSYEVFVSPEDYDDYFGLRKDMLRRHLADVVRRYAEDVGGMLEGEPSFSFQVDGSLEGECRVRCSYRNVARDYGATPVYRVDPSEHLTPRPRFEADDADGGACEEAPTMSGGASDAAGGLGGDEEPAPLEPLPASIRLGEVVHELEPGIVVGVLRDRSRASLPDVELDAEENGCASQIHGRFGFEEKRGLWTYTCLGQHGSALRKGEDVIDVSKGETRYVVDGDQLQFGVGGSFYEFAIEGDHSE